LSPLSASQDSTTYGAIRTSGKEAFLAILILSESAEVAEKAQQAPQ